MDGTRLQDRISYGMGVAARKLGLPFVVYRPRGALTPLSTQNRVIRLCASFNAEDASYRRVSGYGEAVWWGVFDASYTAPGDYLVGSGSTFFVCAQRPALPVQCVRTNCVVSMQRTAGPANLGYAGQVDAAVAPFLSGWPASVLEAGDRSAPSTATTHFGNWRLLLPRLPVAPQIGDIVSDDAGGRYSVGAAEQSDLGWRLLVRQIAA